MARACLLIDKIEIGSIVYMIIISDEAKLNVLLLFAVIVNLVLHYIRL